MNCRLETEAIPQLLERFFLNRMAKLRKCGTRCLMTTRWLIQSTKFLPRHRLVALVFLVGAVCATHSVTAQSENECPLPPNTTPVHDPEVSAQQVDASDADLGEFTREVRDRFKTYSSTVTSMAQIAYFGCVLRQDDGPWRSDSVYPILLTPFGRIVFHTKDMSLSGRLLDPVVLGSIYTALGVSRRDIADLRSSDPDTVMRARRAILEVLAQERDGAFDATNPIPGVRPGIPGASGHVAVYVGRAFRIPLLVISGFDLNIGHVAEEEIDYGAPTITAQDVVDRATLKQFVTEAGNFFIDAQQNTADALLGSQVKVAMRDENGPWRHGSVYVYVLDLRSNIIFIHGANPNRYEFQPLIPTARDVVTGELILPQVIEAAQSNPEGGFIRYFFDDPTDDTDSADTPKVGYAREFVGTIERADGGRIETNYVVGSGFYLNAPAVVALRQNKVIQTVLPQVMRSMTASTVGAISDRVNKATLDSDLATSQSFKLGRFWSLTEALSGYRRGSFDVQKLFQGASFLIPLNNSNAGNGLLSNLTLWGNADFRKLSDDNLQEMAYDGNVTSFNVGVDREVGENLVGGVSLTVARGTVDYTDPELATGEFTTSLTSINPYLGWLTGNGTRLWAAAGFGWGEVEFSESTNAQSSDLSQTMVAAGVNISLMSNEQLISGGTTNLALKGETTFTQASVDDGGSLNQADLNASRHRIFLQGMYSRKLASEAVLVPSITAGLRHDGGDGLTGTGIELGAGVGYTVGRLVVQFSTQSLISHADADDYEEWSVSGTLAYQPSVVGHGISMSIGSSWGTPTSISSATVHTTGLVQNAPILADGALPKQPSPWYHAEVRYDFKQVPGLGIWTSFASEDSGNDYRFMQLGLQFRSGPGFDAGLNIGHQESVYRPSDQSIEIRGKLRW